MSKLTAAFLAHYPDLIRYLRRRTHCSELAQDCAHDTWLRLLEKGKQVTADNHRAYVFRVAANIAADWYRRQTREQDRKSTRLNSSHVKISYAVFCLK